MSFNFPGFIRSIVVYVMMFVLVACGGGGSGSGSGSGISTTPWTKQLGVAGANTYGNAAATDMNGNVYVGGTTLGGLDGNTMTGWPDFFLTKYHASGARLYTRQLGATANITDGYAVATDVNGNVYMVGTTSGGIDGNTVIGTLDAFLTKYDSSGNRLYTKQLGVAGAQTSGRCVTTDASGNVYVGGTTLGNLDGNTLTGTADFFLAKYNSSGVKQYTRQLGVTGGSTGCVSIAADASGNVYITGYTTGGLDGNTLTGLRDSFVTKYDSSGTKLYTRQLGVAGNFTISFAVAPDPSGNVYIGGLTTGGLDGNALTGWTDIFLTKYDSAGTKLFTRQFGATGANTTGKSIATDASGNVYIVGITNAGLDGNSLMGTQDAVLIKYDSTGARLFTRQLGGAGFATDGTAVAIDNARSYVYVAGTTYGGIDGNTVTGTTDFFLAKYSTTGNRY